MEQIKQLRQMRDEAQARIEALPDYKLVTSLDALIADLEEAFGADEGAAEAEEEPSSPLAAAADTGPVEIEAPVEEPAIETNTGVLGADETAAEADMPPSANEQLEASAEDAAADAPPPDDADLVSIFDRGSDPDEADISRSADFGQHVNGSGGEADATPEDEEADAISKAIAELDADLAKTEFGN